MKIYATFANRHYAPEAAELVCAWDEYSIEGNFDGWERDKRKALDAMGKDLLRSATFEIEVDMTIVDAALDPESQGDLPATSIRRDPDEVTP